MSPSPDSNLGPLEYKTEVLPTRPRYYTQSGMST
jgi:hypothetical protein